MTTWVTCSEAYTTTTYTSTPTSTAYATLYATPTYTTKTNTVAVTYIATATKPVYPAKNTTYPAAVFTGAAAGVQSSVLVSGLVGLLALIPAFFL